MFFVSSTEVRRKRKNLELVGDRSDRLLSFRGYSIFVGK